MCVMQENTSPSVENPISAEYQPSEVSTPPANNKKYLIFLVLSLVLVVSGLSLLWLQTRSSTPTTKLTREIAPVASTLPDSTTAVDSQQRLVFMAAKDGDLENKAAWTVWPDGSHKEQVAIEDFTTVYKYPNSQLIFYTSKSDQKNSNILRTKNVETGEVKQYQPAVDVPENIYSVVTLHEMKEVSPDGQHVLIDIRYYQPCEREGNPITGEGIGSGPCPELDSAMYRPGVYLYSLTTDTATYIGYAVAISKWDIVNNRVYVNISHTTEDSFMGLASIKLDTHELTQIKPSNSFVYHGVPLFDSQQVLEVTGDTGDAGATSFSALKLLGAQKSERVIAEGNWADIQPFLELSPSEDKVVFTKSHVNEKGIGIFSLGLYDFQTKQIKDLALGTDTESYNYRGYWLDDEYFITAVDTIEEPFRSDNSYLVKINATTGEQQKLAEDIAIY